MSSTALLGTPGLRNRQLGKISWIRAAHDMKFLQLMYLGSFTVNQIGLTGLSW